MGSRWEYKTELPREECERQWDKWAVPSAIRSSAEAARVKTDRFGRRYVLIQPRYGMRTAFLGYRISLEFGPSPDTVTLRVKRRPMSLLILGTAYVMLLCAAVIAAMAIAGNSYLFENWIGFAGMLVFGGGLVAMDRFERKSAFQRLDRFAKGTLGGTPEKDQPSKGRRKGEMT